MKSILFFGLICLSLTGQSQTGVKTLHFPEVGWTIQVPDSNTSLDHKQVDSFLKITGDKVVNGGGPRLGFQGLKVLFAFLDNDFDSFGGAISSYDSSKVSSWPTFHALVIRKLYVLLESQAPGIKIVDTASSVEIIDGLAFQLFYLKTYYSDKDLILQTYSFSRLQHGVDMNINISFTRKEVGKEFLDILRHSKFDKD